MESFLAKMAQLGQTPNVVLQRSAELIKSTLTSAQTVMAEVAVLRQAYEAAQQRRDFTKRIDLLLHYVEEVRKVSLPDLHDGLH